MHTALNDKDKSISSSISHLILVESRVDYKPGQCGQCLGPLSVSNLPSEGFPGAK